MQIETGKKKTNQRVVIYGPEGIGKSSLGAQFPKPLFADIEGGTAQLDVSRMPKASSWSMFKSQLGELAKDQMGFKTLVIDTADWLERMCERHVCDVAGQASIEDFGYGKGFTKSAEEFAKLLDLLNELLPKMNVVILAHAQRKKVELPEESGAYDRYEMKLSKKGSPLLKEWADMVLFCNYEVIVVEDEKTKSKKAQGGRRVIHTEHHVCWDAKNRHDLPSKLDFPKDGCFAQIAHCFPVMSESAAPKVAHEVQDDEIPLDVHDKPYCEPEDEISMENLNGIHEKADAAIEEKMQDPEPQPEPTGTSVPKTDPASFSGALFDLMEVNGVTEAEIRKAVAAKAYYPEETPIENYAQDFVDAVLIGAWEQVFGVIKANR